MSSYIRRVEALENNEKKKKQIFTAIVVVLIVIFMGGMVIGARSILSTEGTHDPYAVTATEPLASELEAQEIIDEFALSLKNAGNPEAVKLSVYTDVDIPEESIAVESGDEYLLAQLKYIRPKLLDSIKEYYESYEGKFGEDFSNRVIPAAFALEDTERVGCEKGRLDDAQSLADFDTLCYSLEFPETPFESAGSTAVYESLGMKNSQTLLGELLESISGIAQAKNVGITCADFIIEAQAQSETGRIKSVRYCRGYSVRLTLDFKGDLEPLGTQTISFDFYAREGHWYTWAGLELSQSTLSIEKNDIQAIEAFRTADEEVEVRWTSSNPETASVDEQGYVKGHAVSAQPVTITASFDYRGHTYTDECTVYVRKPVEKIKTQPGELEMKVGETEQLTAQLSPKSATIRETLWFTEDEAVALVDENGVVRAVGTGTTKVYAVSADGYYRSSCTVTVE